MDTILAYARWGRRINPLWRLGLTLGFIVLAVVLRWTWNDELQGFLFVMGYPAVLLSCFLFGWTYGLVGIGLNTVAVMFLFIEPRFSLQLSEPHQLAGVITYLIGASLAIFLVESLARTIEQRDCAQRLFVDVMR